MSHFGWFSNIVIRLLSTWKSHFNIFRKDILPRIHQSIIQSINWNARMAFKYDSLLCNHNFQKSFFWSCTNEELELRTLKLCEVNMIRKFLLFEGLRDGDEMSTATTMEPPTSSIGPRDQGNDAGMKEEVAFLSPAASWIPQSPFVSMMEAKQLRSLANLANKKNFWTKPENAEPKTIHKTWAQHTKKWSHILVKNCNTVKMYFFASNTFLDNRILIFNWHIPLLPTLLLVGYLLEIHD